MKILLSFLLALLASTAFSQSVLPLRADTVLIEKTGGSGELKIKNSTRDSLGVLVNIGGGRTRFIRAKALNDSILVIGLDTIRISGGGGSGSVESISTGYGLTGGPITTTGTIRVDSTSLSGYYLRRKDSTFYSTTRGLRDSMYRALNSMPMTSKIEFVQSGNSTTYQDDDLIGKYILMVSGEGYIYGTITRTSGYYSFNAATGTITIHNSQFSDEDYVLILYRTTPIYLTDGSGNFIVDSNGNYIIAN
jgi:hypothetical protein